MFKSFLLIATLAAVAYGAFVPVIQIQTEQRLSAVLMKSSSQMAANPVSSMACFNEYVPKLNKLTQDFERSYGVCVSTAEDRLSALELEMNASRMNLTDVTSATCKAYTDCNTSKMALDFFTCYAGVANGATRSSFEIETTSNQNVGYILIQEENIVYNRDSCCDAASVQYLEESSALYAELEKCLDLVGKLP